MEEYNRKIKEHRRKVLRRTVIVTAVFLLVLTGLGLYMALRHYENYDIMSTAERRIRMRHILRNFREIF